MLSAATEVCSSKRRLERRADDLVVARDPVVAAVDAGPGAHRLRTLFSPSLPLSSRPPQNDGPEGTAEIRALHVVCKSAQHAAADFAVRIARATSAFLVLCSLALGVRAAQLRVLVFGDSQGDTGPAAQTLADTLAEHNVSHQSQWNTSTTAELGWSNTVAAPLAVS